MKIILVANVQYTITHFRSELLSQLEVLGHEVILVCSNPSGHLHVEEKRPFKEIYLSRAGINPIYDFKTFKELMNIFKSEKPDIIFNFTIKPIIYGSLAARFSSPYSKVFSNMTGLGYIFTHKSLKTLFIKKIVVLLYRIALKYNHKVFFQNPDDLKLFEILNIIKPSQPVLLKGSGINLQKIQPFYGNKEPQSFLFVGRLLKDKGLLELILAVKKVSLKYPSMKCYIIGERDDNPNSFSKEEILEFSKIPSIKFLGRRKDVLSFINNCEVFVLPSYREGTPRSNLEAMASGLPIITTDVPGCRETVIDKFNGFLVPIKDANKIAEKMIYFIENPSEIRLMGQKSREFVEKNFDVNVVNHQILKILGI